ncbi:MAG TPA: hypothetical protein VGJ77_19395 [Gaiellaceae bacterium]
MITIHDRSAVHDFHLIRPGVKKTSVPAVGTTKWTVNLKKGTYKFVCDPQQRRARLARRLDLWYSRARVN